MKDFWQGLAGLVLIVGVIISIRALFAYSSFIVFGLNLLSVTVVVAIIYGIGELIQLQEKNNNLLKKIAEELNPSKKNNNNNWLCPRCDIYNSSNLLKCKDCGKLKY